jgi:acyl-CoA reductase-like NAD-dependent aldehyde dehydrogenase
VCLAAAQRLEFGGVTVNEAPTFRADQMPYGGIKASGNTKEGPAWAVREMTEDRLVVLQL